MSWTDDRVERLSSLWLEGWSASQIAAELGEGVTRNAVIGKVHRLGLGGRASLPSSTPETASTSAAPLAPAEASISEDLSTEVAPAPDEIACAVEAAPPRIATVQTDGAASDALQAGEPTADTPPGEPDVARSTGRAAEPNALADLVVRTAIRPIAFDLPAIHLTRDVALPRSDRVTILELAATMCRWPIGDPSSAEFRFCGCRAAATSPYCDDHGRLAFQPVTDRRRVERLIRIA